MAYRYGLWNPREAGTEALAEWIDTVQRRHPSQRWGMWGGAVGASGGLVGAWLGISIGGMNLDPNSFLVWLPVILWFVFIGAMTFWVVRKTKSEVGEWSRESRGMMMRMLSARWQGGLHQLLGDEGTETLNEAAKVWLKTRTVLDSPAWKVAAGSNLWGEMREKVLRSMDSAMARLLLLVSSGSTEETTQVIQDMQAMHEEVARAAQRHSAVSGVSTGGSESLRQTLAEMRELASADEEFLHERKLLDH